MGERLVKDPKNFGSYLFWVPRADNNISEMEKVTEMGKFIVKSSQGKMLSHNHANLMLHTIDTYIRKYNLEKNVIIEFTHYDLAVNGLGYDYLNLGYNKIKDNEDESDGNAKKGINRYIFDKLKDIREISILFQGVFFGESKVTKKSYGIYNSVDMDELTGKIKIQFNEIFTKQLQATKDFVMLDIEEFRLLRPKSASLYQYAIENTQNKPVEKDIRELCEGDLHWGSQKPGKLRKDFIESADEIFSKTNKVLEHEYTEETKNVKFRITNKKKDVENISNSEINEIYNQCPDLLKKHPKIVNELTKYYEEYNLKSDKKENGYSWGYIVVLANVLYVKEKLNNGKIDEEKSWSYFIGCLKNNWGDKFIPIIIVNNSKEINKKKVDILIREQKDEDNSKILKQESLLEDIYNNSSSELKEEISSRALAMADSNILKFPKDSDLYLANLKKCRNDVMIDMGLSKQEANIS